jgi:acyl-coenzyme A synthetase/AMP-(fatty) acid ligase
LAQQYGTCIPLRGPFAGWGEIEAALGQQPGVRAAVVVSRDRRLVAYVVWRVRGRISALRQRLEERLPANMVPAAWVELEALPLTAGGKVDRRRLPEPAWDEEPPPEAGRP